MSITERGDSGKAKRDGPTLHSVAKHTGIPKDSLIFFARGVQNAVMGFHRQLLLSKVISEYENGEINFIIDPANRSRKIVVKGDGNPKVRYAAQLVNGEPRLGYVDRPPRVKRMPEFKDMLLTR